MSMSLAYIQTVHPDLPLGIVLTEIETARRGARA
jgi:hypothetical protein